MKEQREVYARMGDLHIPFHDKWAVELAMKFLSFLEPHTLIVDEWLDWYQVSNFDRDPRRLSALQDDINTCIELLKELRKLLPKTRIIMVESNHDSRMKKFKWKKAPELSSLICLCIPELLNLKNMNMEYKKDFFERKILWKHGNLVRQESGYTARAEFQKEGTCGVSGHTHRLAMYFKRLRGGEYVWIEGGCLCTRDDIEYVNGTPNWQLGIPVIAYEKGKNQFYSTIAPILNYRLLWGKRTFTV